MIGFEALFGTSESTGCSKNAKSLMLSEFPELVLAVDKRSSINSKDKLFRGAGLRILDSVARTSQLSRALVEKF